MVGRQYSFLEVLRCLQIFENNTLCPSLVPIDPSSMALLIRSSTEVARHRITLRFSVSLTSEHIFREPTRYDLLAIIYRVLRFLQKRRTQRRQNRCPEMGHVPVCCDLFFRTLELIEN